MAESEKPVKQPRCPQDLWPTPTAAMAEQAERLKRSRLSRPPWRRGLFVAGQWVATVLAVSGVLCNNARLRWCFPLWVVSNAITLVYHVRARLWGLACRDVVFLVLAVIGWFMWG